MKCEQCKAELSYFEKIVKAPLCQRCQQRRREVEATAWGMERLRSHSLWLKWQKKPDGMSGQQ